MTEEEIIANESYHTCGRCKYDTLLSENMYPCNQCIHGQDMRKDFWKYNGTEIEEEWNEQ